MNSAQHAGMSPLIWTGGTPWEPRKPLAPLGVCALLMMLPTASCVPASIAGTRAIAPVSSPQAPTSGPVAGDAAADPALSAAVAIASFTAPPAVVDPVVGTPAPTGGVLPGAAPAINASIAFAGGPNPAAAAFFLRSGTAADRDRSLQCLTQAIYYEAASESDDGQRAVAQVVLNRMRHPAYPASVCGVVYQNAERWLACQFSFACDGARARIPSASGWARARAHAAQALAGRVHAPVGTATHYHTWNVVPFWARKLEKNAVVGMHIFYRLNGALGQASAFRQRHAGYEPFPTPPRTAPVQVAFTPLPSVAMAVETAVELAQATTPPVPAATPLPRIAAPRPATKTRTVPAPIPEPAPSPIMRAVESSTVLDKFKNSGTIRPEFARPVAASPVEAGPTAIDSYRFDPGRAETSPGS